MTIEVKQMQIKSTVLQERRADAGIGSANSEQDFEEVKDHILAECRQLIIEMLDQKRER